MHSQPHYQCCLPEWYIFYKAWAYMDTSWSPQVHSFSQGSLLVLDGLFFWCILPGGRHGKSFVSVLLGWLIPVPALSIRKSLLNSWPPCWEELGLCLDMRLDVLTGARASLRRLDFTQPLGVESSFLCAWTYYVRYSKGALSCQFQVPNQFPFSFFTFLCRGSFLLLLPFPSPDPSPSFSWASVLVFFF